MCLYLLSISTLLSLPCCPLEKSPPQTSSTSTPCSTIVLSDQSAEHSSCSKIPLFEKKEPQEKKSESMQTTPRTQLKKAKPHFAGVRRPVESKQKTEKKKPSSSKVRNKWIKTQTHRKAEKKEAENPASEESFPAQLPYLN